MPHTALLFISNAVCGTVLLIDTVAISGPVLGGAGAVHLLVGARQFYRDGEVRNALVGIALLAVGFGLLKIAASMSAAV